MEYEAPKVTLEREGSDSAVLNPWEIIEPVIRNRWFILLTILVCFLLGVFYNQTTVPIYRAKSTIMIQRRDFGAPIRQREASLPVSILSMTAFNTYVKLLNSEAFAQRLVKKLIEAGYYKDYLEQAKYDQAPQEKKDIILSKLAKSFASQIDVNNQKMTDLVDISFTHQNRLLVRDVVNFLADIAEQYNTESKEKMIEASLSYLQHQVEERRQSLEEVEYNLYKYRKEKGIFDNNADKILIQGHRGDLQAKLSDLVQGQRQLEANIISLDSILARKDFTKYTATIDGNVILLDIHSRLVNAEIEYEKLLTKYQPAHPLVIKAKGEVEVYRNTFEQEMLKGRTKLESELASNLAQQSGLKLSIDQDLTAAVAETENDIELNILEKKADTENELFRIVSTATQEASIAQASAGSGMISIVDRANTPERPIKPNKRLNLMLALGVGMLLGVGFAYGREYLDASVRNPEDVRKATNLPVLSTVPLYISRASENAGKAIYITKHPKSLFSESITTLRTHLNIKLPQEKPLSLAITSSVPKEGKSLIAANLAASMAVDGRSTVLVDCDLHRPSIHKLFGMDKRHGLFDMIVDAFNPRWSEINVGELSFGDLKHLIKLKQWSGTIKVQWDSLPMDLAIGFNEGKPVGSNIEKWREAFAGPTGFPAPVDPKYSLDDSTILESDRINRAGDQAIDFMSQYPRINAPSFFINKVIKEFMKPTDVENLHVLTAGASPKNPNEILGSEQMAILVQILKERYDRLIIDCPPAWPLSDVSVLSPLIDGLIWVCRAGETPKNLLARNVNTIRAIQPNILGVVINAVDLKRDRYYYYGYSYYYYRYYKSDYYKDLSREMNPDKKRSLSSQK